MTRNADPIEQARLEFRAGDLRSTRFGDSYFMPGQGLAESQAVFIEGNDLPARFQALGADQLFVIGENGFGSGLNTLLAADCFDRHAHPSAWLRIFSVEKYPLSRRDLARALDSFPTLRRWARTLLDHYPPPVPGHHRVVLSDRIDLVLMLGDCEAIWPRMPPSIDAWFLDGFAPSCNPGMWTERLFRALADCSRPGATLSTFTAAGQVRRGLQAAGFKISKVAGFGPKRDRLDGRWSGDWRAAALKRGQALVAGAGLAGATLARALAERGWQLSVIDRDGPASGASGNAAGVLYTTPSAHLTPQNRFYQTAFVRARDWLLRHDFPNAPSHGQLNDVLQYPTSDRHRAKLEQALESGAWPGELMSQDDRGAFILHGGGFLHPPSWINHLLDHPSIDIDTGLVRSVHSGGRIRLADGRDLTSDAVAVCLAHHSTKVAPLDWLFVKRIRGQVSEYAATESSLAWQRAICHGGYLTPALAGRHCVGATYDLKRPGHGIDPDDDQANLEQLRAFLPNRWAELGGQDACLLDHRVGVRCQSPDFLPQAGALPDPRQQPHQWIPGVYMNIAHGSRGLTHTPLTADLLADQISGLPSSVEPDLIEALAPERFILRARRRQPDWGLNRSSQ